MHFINHTLTHTKVCYPSTVCTRSGAEGVSVSVVKFMVLFFRLLHQPTSKRQLVGSCDVLVSNLLPLMVRQADGCRSQPLPVTFAHRRVKRLWRDVLMNVVFLMFSLPTPLSLFLPTATTEESHVYVARVFFNVFVSFFYIVLRVVFHGSKTTTLSAIVEDETPNTRVTLQQ